METGAIGQDRLLVWIQDRSAVVRVQGRGSFKLGAALREFATSAMAAGADRLILDLEVCVGMDSTFMGVVAGLALNQNTQGTGRVIFTNLTERTRHLLCTLGLDRFVDLHMAGQTPEDLAAALVPPRAPKEAAVRDSGAPLSKTILDAHEALVSLDAENLGRFRDVLEFLRKDVAQGSSGKG
ncbi:MAG: STAS domain-containing protein [Kiritimatiellia bacterium]|nr:STAS domain-containing protein [Kiritimatiellia bacterium]